MSFPRAELEAAFRKTREAQDRNDWSGYVDCFTEDAVYVEHQLGVFRGREAIRKWLVDVMKPFHDWSFPTEWLAIDGERLVFMWQNRLPGQRADGSPYQFSGVTSLVYAGNGLFSLQEDIYNFEETKRVMKEWAADQSKAP